jgi:hypothetical protein
MVTAVLSSAISCLERRRIAAFRQVITGTWAFEASSVISCERAPGGGRLWHPCFLVWGLVQPERSGFVGC